MVTADGQRQVFMAQERWGGCYYGPSGWSSLSQTMTTTEPATGRVLATVAIADKAVVSEAAAAAATEQRGWAGAPSSARATVLRRAAAIFAEHALEIREWLVREAGSIGAKADAEVQRAIGECLEGASLCSQPTGVLLQTDKAGRASSARRVPVGVVGVIAPWNAPLTLAMRSVAPALALGNAVLLKADPNTPVSGGVVIARVFEEAGLPPGVLSVFCGEATAGEALVEDPHVGMISFTGSTAVGRRVGEAAGRSLKRVALELGGNNPFIVLDDADIDVAASAGATGSFFHQGQICMASGRHIVHERVADEYLQKLSARAAALRVGDPHTEQVSLGPLINEGQAARVERIVDATVAAGATARVGGKRAGLFFPPTVLSEVGPDTPAWTEEIFGPVAPVRVVSSDEEAISLANASDLGLSAAIHSASPERAQAMAAQLRSGMIHVNDLTVNDEPGAPFSGFGSSGNGVAFGGPANQEAFTEWQWTTYREQRAVFPF